MKIISEIRRGGNIVYKSSPKQTASMEELKDGIKYAHEVYINAGHASKITNNGMKLVTVLWNPVLKCMDKYIKKIVE